jgi:RND family efflux transporter MFP subunit
MKQLLKNWTMLLIAVAILVIVLLFNYFRIVAESNRPMPVKAEKVQSPAVEVVSVSPAQYQAKITSYGEATPHFELSLSAQVSGQIEQLNANFETGQRVKKGEILIQLEDSEYQAAVASAENNLATVKLALLEEQRRVAQAETEWQGSGLQGEPESELVLRQPQLKAAMTAVKQTESALANARKDLSRTKVIAPFNALVVERNVSLGAYVQPSTAVAVLYSTERVEVKVDLSAKDWLNLPNFNLEKSNDLPVKLLNVEGKSSWDGRILRVEQHLDGDTRQRALVVAVDKPLDQQPALYPGTFLKVQVDGRRVDQLWKLPSSALSQRGEIWYVTKENTLANFTADPIFTENEAIYIVAPEAIGNETQRVLFHPLSSYLQGMKVKAVEKVVNND